jgi:hypothetical protein
MAVEPKFRKSKVTTMNSEKEEEEDFWNWTVEEAKPSQPWDADITQLLLDFNKRYYVVSDFGGKCRVVWEEQNPLIKDRKSLILCHQSFGDFKNSFIHQLIKVGEKKDADHSPIWKDYGTVWLTHPSRRQYDRVVFAPNQRFHSGDEGKPVTIHNLWTGFAFTPEKGDCSLYLNHLRENVCRGHESDYRYLLSWMAYGVRYPNENGHVCVVVRGKKGVGKNVFAEAYGDLWGQHSLLVTQSSQVTGNFNAHLRDKCVLVADEAFFAGSRAQERIIKGLITGKNLTIEAKGIDVVEVQNLLHIIVISNDDWIVRASGDERRFFCLDCGEAHREDHPYFARIEEQMKKGGGYAALLHHLLFEVDLTNFQIRNAPRTATLLEQMTHSVEGIDGVWLHCLIAGRIPGEHRKENKAYLRKSKLQEWAAKQNRREWQSIPAHTLDQFFGVKGMDFNNPALTLHGERIRYLEIPTLTMCRELWDRKRWKVEWANADDDWEMIPDGPF